jgi:hypothetical protein
VFATFVFAFQLSAAAPPPPAVRGVTELVTRARAARWQQDSMLAGYETTVRQRISSSIGISAGITAASGLPLAVVGPPRLAARFESVARVGWSQASGAWAEIVAARSVVPMLGDTRPEAETGEASLVLPYYPGRDWLWPTTELYRALPSARDWIVHPLSTGADSVYEFSAGDSLDIRLPDRRVIHLREIRVSPRRPSSRLIVGSLWIDGETGNLVRTAYRPSTAIDLWPIMERNFDSDDRKMARKFGPYTGTIREIIVDNGLYEGRFWLPRTRIANAEGTASGGRITLSIEQTFQYGSVTARAAGAPHVDLVDTVKDVDPRTGRVREPEWYRVHSRGSRCRLRGDTASSWRTDSVANAGTLGSMTADGIRFTVLMPCDARDLATSPELPPSIYGSDEALFPQLDLDALYRDADRALSMDRQANWKPQPYVFHYGIDRAMVRYNRVEGLSAGVNIERDLGKGYTEGALVRLGAFAPVPVGELYLKRSNVATDLQGVLYRRLAATNDWGNPLGPGASVNALLFGRDDGFYYRTLGAELTGTRSSSNDGLVLRWRLFGERQSTATVETQGSLAHAVNGREFAPNIEARRGNYFGAGGILAYSRGDNPAGLRVSGNTRVESATGETSFGRAMTELTLTRGLGERTSFALTGAAGSSLGALPTQRWWFLGSPYTVHGQSAGVVSGDAFWLGRAELSRGYPLFRPIVFADIGWAGERDAFARNTRPVSGAGAGVAMLDGLVRFDVSRGLRPTRGFRADLYLEIR